MKNLKASGSYYGEFCTQRFDTGAATDADSTPTATATKNGADDGSFSLTVTKIDTGRYKITGTVPAYTAGDIVQISVAATVNSVAGKGVVDEFVVVSGRPGTDDIPIEDAVLATSQPNYEPAKAGDAMTLTSAYDAAKTAAQAGDKMDIVDAPNSTAVTAIQAGLAKPSDIPSAGSVADAVLDEALGSHTGFLTGLLTAAGYTAPPSVGDIANAVWGAATRSLTEKTGFSLSVTPPTAQNIWEYATRALTDKSGFSGSGTVTDKTGFSLSVTPPTAGDIATAVWGAVTRSLTDKADFSLSTDGILAVWHQLLASIATVGSIGKLIKDNLDAKVSEVGGGSLTAESIRIEMDANSKLANLPADPADESSLEAAITAAHATTDALISAITGGGLTEKTYTLTDASTGLPLAGVQVWATTDEAGEHQVDITRTTNDAGQVTFRFNLAAGTPIYIWNRYMAEGDAPDEEEV